MNIAVVPLGCSKNTVDLERMLGRVLAAGHTLAPDLFLADLVIVNTCGFIESAKQEAIENILILAKGKQQNPDMKIVVTGCLAQRYQNEIMGQLPEVDAVVTPGKNDDIVEIIKAVQQGDSAVFTAPVEQLSETGDRVLLSPPHYAFLKIADGCDNRCSYCAIPLIRGRRRSRPMAAVIDEAKTLVRGGKKELILIAQDTTAFGEDTGDGSLTELLFALDEIEGLSAIRVMYAYPEFISAELCKAMANCKSVLHYIDMPIQHISDNVLARMNRRGGRDTILNAIALLRAEMPDIVLRTTVMVGFPGENEEDFNELLQFVRQGHFEHLGCFAFSPEEGTAAAVMDGRIPTKVKEERREQIMQAQYEVVRKRQAERVGQTLEAYAEDVCDQTGRTILRANFCAPEVDTSIFCDEHITLFGRYLVKITETEEYDLVGEIVEEL